MVTTIQITEICTTLIRKVPIKRTLDQYSLTIYNTIYSNVII